MVLRSEMQVRVALIAAENQAALLELAVVAVVAVAVAI